MVGPDRGPPFYLVRGPWVLSVRPCKGHQSTAPAGGRATLLLFMLAAHNIVMKYYGMLCPVTTYNSIYEFVFLFLICHIWIFPIFSGMSHKDNVSIVSSSGYKKTEWLNSSIVICCPYGVLFQVSYMCSFSLLQLIIWLSNTFSTCQASPRTLPRTWTCFNNCQACTHTNSNMISFRNTMMGSRWPTRTYIGDEVLFILCLRWCFCPLLLQWFLIKCVCVSVCVCIHI